ncbi:MAG: hypothetical protein WDO69_30760 [Pseudomonadota bacterium]
MADEVNSGSPSSVKQLFEVVNRPRLGRIFVTSCRDPRDFASSSSLHVGPDEPLPHPLPRAAQFRIDDEQCGTAIMVNNERAGALQFTELQRRMGYPGLAKFVTAQH